MKRTIRHDAVICTLLALLACAAFWGVLGNGFILYDDPQYVTENYRVSTGLSLENLAWAFTTGHAANWHPVTWLSHQLDAQLFGLEPRGHHMVSLLVHCANTALLFLALFRLTGARWRSMLVAALFAVHPLHVESVAWVAERKDLLSTFFGLAALFAYLQYVNWRGVARYLLLVLLFALSLMSKPMLVTLPLVLLLLDWWPLGRISGAKVAAAEPLTRLVLEKLPLLALSLISSWVTVLVQSGEALNTLEATPLSLRISNAMLAYVRYLGKLVWPADLAVLYPLPKEIPLLLAAGCAAFLLLASWQAFRLRHRFPYLMVGWFWFLGTLVPVIGLVQVGLQSMADRYCYLPMVGILIVAVWGACDLVEHRPSLRLPLSVAAGLLVVGYGAVSWDYQRSWQDSTTLFSRALAATGDNYYGHYLLGNALSQEQRYPEALEQLALSRQLAPRFADAYINTGIIHARLGNQAEAIRNFSFALELKPESGDLQYNLALCLQKQGRVAEAVTHYLEAVRLKPSSAEAQANLGIALMSLGRFDEALRHLSESLRLRPDLEQTRAILAECTKRMGNPR